MEIKKLVKKQRQFYNKGKTKSYDFRMSALTRLEDAVKKHEKELLFALHKDLRKSSLEAYMTEIGLVLNEIEYVKKHLKKWMKDRGYMSPLSQFPSRSFEVSEPYGVVLIMSPWNYPVLLALEPMIGAIAAGNCCILKVAADAPAVSKVLKDMFLEIFPQYYVSVVTGGRSENQALLNQKFDYIFFTGSVSVGRFVMEKATKHLTPVTLELGGKSPCIVEKTANLKLAAKRIVFGKFLNSGQTCVAPDYVLADNAIQRELIYYLKYWIFKMYGRNPLENSDYPRMVNEKHYQRVMHLMKSGTIVAGGYGNPKTKKIAPTLLTKVMADSPIMQEEIFGPVLPILTYHDLQDAKDFIQSRPKPLALYLFTKNKTVERDILRNLSFGGGCINDTVIHLATSKVGFGGVGESGMGSYHGKYSFDTFSHRKSIVKKALHFDIPIRYAPYTKAKETVLRLFMKY